MKAKQNTEPDWLNITESKKLRDDAFEAPAGYFNQLGLQLQNRISEKENVQQSKKSLFILKPAFYIPAAASVLILIFASVKYLNEQHAGNTYNEQMALQLMYDASYAEEALIAENQLIENELNATEDQKVESDYIENLGSASHAEITDYLIDAVNESELIIEIQ